MPVPVGHKLLYRVELGVHLKYSSACERDSRMVGRGMCVLSGRGLGCSRMHYHTFASAMPSVERTTASAGEVVVAHPSPAPGNVDGMSGDLAEKGRVWLGQELGRIP